MSENEKLAPQRVAPLRERLQEYIDELRSRASNMIVHVSSKRLHAKATGYLDCADELAAIALLADVPCEAVGALDLSAPERIWLQVDTNGDADDRSDPISRDCWGEMSWHYEQIGGQEVEYIRSDLAAAPTAGGRG